MEVIEVIDSDDEDECKLPKFVSASINTEGEWDVTPRAVSVFVISVWVTPLAVSVGVITST